MTVSDSAYPRKIAFLTVRVKANRPQCLPIIGVSIGRTPNRVAKDISALIKFIHPNTREALLRAPTAGIWAQEGDGHLPASDYYRTIDSTLAPGNSLLLLVAAKLEGESKCYALEITTTMGLFNTALVVNRPEAALQIDLAAQGLSAGVRFQLQNPSIHLEEFTLTKG